MTGPADPAGEALAAEIRRQAEAGESLLPASLSERFGVPFDVAEAAIRAARGPRIGGFEILGEIGRGAAGTVYRARDPELRREVALKVLHPTLTMDAGRIERFRQEASAAARLSHPNIVPLFSSGCDGGVWYSAMEYVPGRSLRAEIEERRARGEAAPSPGEQAAVARRFADLAEALHTAHEAGILHRDVKPANVLVTPDGTLRLADFGLARDEGDPRLTRSGEAVGTPLYMSPEQVSGRPGDRRSDVYSLGVTLYEALTLAPPHEGESVGEVLDRVLREDLRPPRALGRRLSAELVAIVFRAAEKEPDRRYATAMDLAGDLRAFADGRPVRARPVGALRRLGRRLRRNRLAVAAALATALAVLGAVFGPAAWRSVAADLAGRTDRRARAERDREARSRFAAAADLSPRAAIAALRALREDLPGAEVVPELDVALADLLQAEGDRRGAQASRASALAADPAGRVGLAAALAMGRAALEEGYPGRARGIGRRVLQRTRDPAFRGRACLLLAEAELLDGAADQAGGFLANALSAPLDGTDRARAGLVGEVLAGLGASLVFPWPGETPDFLTGGRFTGAGFEFVACRSGEAPVLYRPGDQALSAVPLPGLPPLAGGVQLDAVEISGDGREDLITVTGAMDIRMPKVLEAWSLADGRPRRLLRADVPDAAFAFGAGDVTGDGRADLLVAMGFPHRGVIVYEAGEGSTFARVDPGDLADLEDGGSDATGVAAADLEGRGANDLVVCLGPHRSFSIAVYRYDPAARTFRRRHQTRAGMVGRAVVRRGDGGDAIWFGLGAARFGTAEDHATFLPQGIYEARLDEAGTGLRVTPLLEEARLDGILGDRGGWFAYGVRLGVLRRREGTPLLLFDVAYFVGYEGAPRYLGVIPATGISGPGIGIALTDREPVLGDVDGDGDDEVAYLAPGGLGVHGVGGPVGAAAVEIPSPEAAPLPSADLRFDTALGVTEMDLADAAAAQYRELWTEFRGRPQGTEAFRFLVDALRRRQRFAEAVEVCREHARTCPRDRVAAGFEEALSLEASGDLAAAAGIYRALLDAGGLRELERARAEAGHAACAPWLREVPVPVPALDEWRVTEPGRFRGGGEDELEVAASGRAVIRAFAPVRWNRGACRLGFDLRVDELEYASSLGVGFGEEAPERPRLPRGFGLVCSNTTGAPAGGGVQWALDGNRTYGDAWHQRTGQMLPLRRWMRVTLLVCAGAGRLLASVRDAESGEVFSFLDSGAVPPLQDVEMPLVVTVMGETPNRVRFRVRGLTLSRPAEAPAFRAAPFGLSVKERAWTDLALGREADALARLREVAGDPSADLVAAILAWRAGAGGDGVARVRAALERAGGDPEAVLFGMRALLAEEEIGALR